MNNRLVFIPEPKLAFGHSQPMEDPRDGLTLFGPFDSLKPHRIQAGVIGTTEGLELYKKFVGRLQQPIYSPLDKVRQRPHFPGFETVFGVQWSPDPDAFIAINPADLEESLAIPNVKERTHAVVNLYVNPLKRFQQEEETTVELWFIVIPRQVWLDCRPESQSKKGTLVSSSDIQAYTSGQRSLFAEMADEIEEAIDILDSSADFRVQLKARLLKEQIQAPVQIFIDCTLQFQEKYRRQEYAHEMKAHLAWTTSSTLFYKLGKLPWKLQGIRKGVCYVGLTFKKLNRVTTKGYACSAAQMFLDSGDGTVFRGNVGPWLSKNEKDFHLDRVAAKDLISKALQSYFAKRGDYPIELFIHGRARFTADEWQGFKEAVSSVGAKTQLVGIVIQDSIKVRLFRHVLNEPSNYGVLRGLAMIVNPREAFLFSRGFVPRLGTSLSLELPRPLRIQIDKGEANIEQVLKDVLALSKLNYNACLFADGLPVTLRFTDNIGAILTAIDDLDVAVLPFKYYI